MAHDSPTTIILADDVVAYLPVWLARELEPEIDLANGRRLTWSDTFPQIIPQSRSKFVNPTSSEENRTGDKGCLNSILEAWRRGERCIGICDPCEIPVIEKCNELVIVGGLIKHACFWCLAHPDIAGARRPEDLNATHLAIHEKGFATGFHIGHHIAKIITDSHPGLTVTKAFGEFGLVVDGAIWWTNHKEKNAAAISASILSAALAHESGELKVAFPIHALEKFQNFLTTGIVVHRESLKDQNFRNHVCLLLFGIILARRFMINSRAGTIKFIQRLCEANNQFSGERRILSTAVGFQASVAE